MRTNGRAKPFTQIAEVAVSGTTSITVLAVDDHPIVRGGLCAFLSGEPDIVVIGEAATATEAIQLFFRLKPAVVVMDLLLPDFSGTEAVSRICAEAPSARILMLTTVSADEEIYRALEAGARGFLLKDMVRTELLQAIREIHAGKRYIPAAVATHLAENLPRPGLTSREIDVLRRVASGMRNKEVAYELGVAETTVNAHIQHILMKLNVADRTQAVTVALRRGFIRI